MSGDSVLPRLCWCERFRFCGNRVALINVDFSFDVETSYMFCVSFRICATFELLAVTTGSTSSH